MALVLEGGLSKQQRDVIPSLRRAPTDIARFCLYTRRDCRRVRPKVLFVNNVMPGDYESLDPGRPVRRGISNQSDTTLLRVSAGHRAISRGRRIPIHDSKVVSVKGRGAIALGIGCISGCEGLGELGNRVVASWFCLLVRLCDREFLADLNRCGFILARPTGRGRANFLPRCRAPWFRLALGLDGASPGIFV